jgi:hypothetical protein
LLHNAHSFSNSAGIRLTVKYSIQTRELKRPISPCKMILSRPRTLSTKEDCWSEREKDGWMDEWIMEILLSQKQGVG